MPKASLVAKYVLSLSNPDAGDIISNLKLQKLLYYVQGFHLAIFGQCLFNEKIYAWELGPVVLDVYHEYKDYEAKALPVPTNTSFERLAKKQKNLIEEIYKVYGQFSSWKLSEMTHSEPPWKNAKRNEVITERALREYFVTLLVK